MDYEQKIKDYMNSSEVDTLYKNMLNNLFPELKESEDEKVIRDIKVVLESSATKFFKEEGKMPIWYDRALAWLDKQGEPKHANKVEPRFKVGDWVIDSQGIVHQIGNVIENVTNRTYSYDIVGGGYFNDNTEGVRLWTIQDAKDGDVLVASDGSIFLFFGTMDGACKHHVALTTDGAVKVNKGLKHLWETSIAVHPATKEQRDLLFQKMHEAGYMWDAEKKELKKIEQK